MAFWSGEKLKELVPKLGVVYPYDERMIDCSAFTLTLGPEYFVSPDHSVPFYEIRKKRLEPAKLEEVKGVQNEIPGEEMIIPPGQFAYLLTEEFVKIPHHVMGFISLKFGVKGPGLINVSGFHVDPGYHGRLVFSVYNAGPAPTRLHRGQRVFLLWLADLNEKSEFVKPASDPRRESISENMISKVEYPIHSLQDLSRKIEKLDNDLNLFRGILRTAATIVTIVIASTAMIYGVLRFYSGSPSG